MTGFDVEVIAEFDKIKDDEALPQNIRVKIENIISVLNESATSVEFKTSKALEQLDEISEETNVPDHIRTQIWSIVSILESIN